MKDLLKLAGYTALILVVGGALALGGEVVAGKVGGWIGAAVGLCGVLALMCKVEKNGLMQATGVGLSVLVLVAPVHAGATANPEPGPSGPTWAELSPAASGLSWASLSPGTGGLSWAGLTSVPAAPGFCSDFTSDETQGHCTRWQIVQGAAVCAACAATAAACVTSAGTNRLACYGAGAACSTCIGMIPCVARQLVEAARDFERWMEEQGTGEWGCPESSYVPSPICGSPGDPSVGNPT